MTAPVPEIPDEPAFYRREWVVQRIGWVVICIVVASAAIVTGRVSFVLRAAAIYGFLVVIFRIAGKRSLAEITTFDLLLVLIISEATQQAMIPSDTSIVAAIIVISTLVGIDITLSLIKQRFPRVAKVVDGLPMIVVRDGQILEERAAWERIDRNDILAEARRVHGIERLDQIKYAVVEESGGISIIPK